MSDIMERLSQWHAATGAPSYKEAADEIERLRAINAELLAALELMVVRLSQFYEFHGPIDEVAFATARAAIAKAKP